MGQIWTGIRRNVEDNTFESIDTSLGYKCKLQCIHTVPVAVQESARNVSVTFVLLH